MWATLSTVSFWWKAIKVLAFVVPISFAWWYSGSADNLRETLKQSKSDVADLKSALVAIETVLRDERSTSDRLELSVTALQKSREEVIDQRNNAWAKMGEYKAEKESYLSSENLNATEQDYVECQPVPVPDSRKPIY